MSSNFKKRIQASQLKQEDQKTEVKLRPEYLKDFVGQKQIKQNLKIAIRAACERQEPLDHLLLYGPPGLGKTTLAHIIAKETGAFLHTASGPAISRAGDLVAILTNLEPGDVLFIDEIHRLNRQIEEVFYSAMEDFKIDIIVGKGPSAKTLGLDIPAFTLIGATTKLSSLSSPLRDRFGIVYRLKFYKDQDIQKIIYRSAKILNIDIDTAAAKTLALRSRKTPRIANRLLRRVRDYCQVKSDGKICHDLTKKALDLLGIDVLGLDEIDRRILNLIIDKFKGGPVGLKTLAAAISEEKDTIAEVYEPFLIQAGLLGRTARGRIATDFAYQHLNRIKKNQDQLI